ncbi:MAG: dockerin type I repeat-containing protein [Clostridia bacterium]|nr:dockerin type I repeat-containing protein [Clostridia bacterium]
MKNYIKIIISLILVFSLCITALSFTATAVDANAALAEIPYDNIIGVTPYGFSGMTMYSEAEAAQANIPAGYSGYVFALKSQGTGAGIAMNFSAQKIPVSAIEAINFRVYCVNTRSFRITANGGSSWLYMLDNPTNNQWIDISISKTQIDLNSLTDENGNLKPFGMGFRLTAEATCYIDSVSLSLNDEVAVLKEIPFTFVDNVYGRDSYNIYNSTSAISANVPEGYSGYVLGLSRSNSGISIGIDFSGSEIAVASIEEMRIRVYCSNTREIRITNGNSSGPWFVQYAPANGQWIDLVLKSDGTNFNPNCNFNNLSDANGLLSRFSLCFRLNGSATCYVDSVEIIKKQGDFTPPVITYEGDAEITTNAGKTIDFKATAFDAYDNREVTVERIWSDGALDSFGLLNEGRHTCTLSATDYFGNTSTVTITVIAKPKDTEAPVINCTITEVYAETGTRPMLSIDATDNDSVTVTQTWSDGAINNYGRLNKGEHSLTVTATDPTGNESIHIILFYVTDIAEDVGNLYEDEAVNSDIAIGDIDANDDVNIFDFIKLKKYYSNSKYKLISVYSADCDKNGKIELNDLVFIKKHLLDVIDLNQ